jgi:cupin fold WbuC family metalloprotein
MPSFLDGGAVVHDPSARSLSYYCTEGVVRIDREVIRQLVEAATTRGRGRARICLHKSPAAALHEMLVVEHQAGYYRPHKHLQESESCHIIEGRAAMCVFDEVGEITHACLMSP